MYKLLNCIATLACAFASSTAIADQKAIDDFHRSCLERSEGVTSGMLNCIQQTHSLYEKEMTESYRKLKFFLPPKKQIALRNAQRKWIIFRDQELKNISEFYSDIDGTMYLVTAAEDKMALTKNRAESLNSYLVILDHQN
jgi:uncharacterized protein YecT (DUF1311 family)